MKKNILMASLLAGASLFAGGAQAALTADGGSFTNSLQLTDFGLGVTDANGDVIPPQTGNLSFFNSDLGTLTSVTIDLTVAMTTVVTLTNTSSGSLEFGANAEVDMFLDSSSTAMDSVFNSSVNVNPNDTQGNTAGSGSAAAAILTDNIGLVSLAVGQSKTFTPDGGTSNPYTQTVQITLTDAASLAAFEQAGGGNFTMSCGTNTWINQSIQGGGADAAQTTSASCGAGISYGYNLVPEPSGLTLMVVSGIAAAAARRKRKAA